MSLSVILTNKDGKEVFSSNITHNLAEMAREAGIYNAVWRPDENGITHARQVIEPLTKGVLDMTERKEHYQQFDSPNGWGTYDRFVPWCAEYLKACILNPNATIDISR